MTKVKKEKLVKYLALQKALLAAGVTEKHKNNPETYLNFLKREIKVVETQLEESRLDGVK